MIHPVVVNPVLSPVVRVTDPVRWRAGKLASDGAILHWDADIDAFSEQTGGPHTFNHNVLSPQYQRNADGSYRNVGAKPAVDVFDGEKFLRSCGAVTNLLPSGAEDISGLAWAKRGTAQVAAFSDGANLVTGIDLLGNDVFTTVITSGSVPVSPAISIKKVSDSGVLLFLNPVAASSGKWEIDLSLLGDGFEDIHSTHPAVTVVNTHVSASAGGTGLHFRAKSGGPLSFYARNPQLTATSYPVPYVPPGVTQPASNATTTNGSWFTLPDGSELWKALTGQPLTLATRVRMGVGSGDIAGASEGISIISSKNSVLGSEQRSKTPNFIALTNDGSATASSASEWPRNAIINRITQVNTAGTQFRVGYMIEGTHTAIQWGSWVAFDGSFNPSTLYRLLLGYNNPYPMWFNKITAWKKQVTDAEILEAMA